VRLRHALCRVLGPALEHYGLIRPEKREGMRHPRAGRGFAKIRVEAFSDGVFAVALTLLIVDLSTTGFPQGFSAKDWVEFWPRLAAWFASTAAVGMYWVAHHNEMAHVASVNRIMLWRNLLFLILIVLFPFSARMLGAHWAEQDELFRRVPIFIFGCNLIFAGLALGWFWRYAARPQSYYLTYGNASDPEIEMTNRRNASVPEVGTILLIVGLSAPRFAQIGLVLLPAVYTSVSVWYAYEQTKETERRALSLPSYGSPASLGCPATTSPSRESPPRAAA
jgi:uncharacterized membrane protein